MYIEGALMSKSRNIALILKFAQYLGVGLYSCQYGNFGFPVKWKNGGFTMESNTGIKSKIDILLKN